MTDDKIGFVIHDEKTHICSTCYSLPARRCISIIEDNMMDGRACNRQLVREGEISERMIHHLRMPPIRIRVNYLDMSRFKTVIT